MLTIEIKGLDRMRADLLNKEKQVNYAAMIAINNVAFKARDAIKTEIRRVFTSPTPWVLGGTRVVKATRASLRAQVDLDFWGNKQGVAVDRILDAQIHGGVRSNKRHEVALNRAGILPDGMRIIPGDAARLDQHGNMTSGQIVQIMSYFKSFGEQGYQANISDRRKKSLARDKKKSGARGFTYFALQKARGRLMPGVYQRFETAFGSAVKPVMIFVRATSYQKRLDFYGIGQRVADRDLDAEFAKALDHATRTAR